MFHGTRAFAVKRVCYFRGGNINFYENFITFFNQES